MPSTLITPPLSRHRAHSLRKLTDRLARIEAYAASGRMPSYHREVALAMKLIRSVWPYGQDTRNAVERMAAIDRAEIMARAVRKAREREQGRVAA